MLGFVAFERIGAWITLTWQQDLRKIRNSHVLIRSGYTTHTLSELPSSDSVFLEEKKNKTIFFFPFVICKTEMLTPHLNLVGQQPDAKIEAVNKKVYNGTW